MKKASCGCHNWTPHADKQKHLCGLASDPREQVGGPRQAVFRTVGVPLEIQGHPKKREQAIQRHHYPISANNRSTAPGDPEMVCLGSHLGR